MADGFGADSTTGLARRSIVIVDGHDITRAGLRSLIERLTSVSVVGEATGAAAALRMCAAEQPELIVVDASMGGFNGDSLIAQLRRASPASSIIALSSEHGPHAVISAIQAGAKAFLLRDSASGVLAEALERVLAGEAFVDPTLAGEVVQAFAVGPGASRSPLSPEPLTPREVEVLRSIARGRSNKEIAFDLKLATGTVKVHVERILRKLSVANRAEATMHAVRLGILDPDDEARPPATRPSKPH